VDGFTLVFCLIAFLAVYEAVRGVIAFRKRERLVLVTKDFVAATVIGSVVVMILYVWHEYF
jgi:uncharacterized membrane protein YdbT with pleckstrin-like domain